MTPTTTDAWTLARVVAVESVGDELASVSEAIRPLVAMLAAVPLEHRQAALTAFLAGQPGADGIVLAMAQADPMGPPPVIEPPRRFATCADVMRLETTAPWTWEAWLPSARVVGIAAGEGVGKTRLAMDLARRVWHGEPWPDNQPMTLQPESPTLWVAADGQHTELAQSLPTMNMPPEAIIFPTAPDDPFGGVSLDEPETLKALGEAVEIHRPAFVVVDSLTYATRSDIGEQRAIATLKDPLVTLAQAHQIIVMLLLHVSREGQALGRRIRGITRTLMHLECPDASQADRLRLWVEKSYAAKPPALGVTIGVSGNTYDSNPPTRMDTSKGGRPPEERGKARRFIADNLAERNDQIGNELCTRWEQDHGGSEKTFWRAVKRTFRTSAGNYPRISCRAKSRAWQLRCAGAPSPVRGPAMSWKLMAVDAASALARRPLS